MIWLDGDQYYGEEISDSQYRGGDYTVVIPESTPGKVRILYNYFFPYLIDGTYRLASIDAAHTTAVLQYDFDAAQKALRTRLEAVDVALTKNLSLGNRVQFALRYNSLKSIIDKISNHPESIQETYNLYGKYQLWKGADNCDLATSVNTLLADIHNCLDREETIYKDLIEAVAATERQVEETRSAIKTITQGPWTYTTDRKACTTLERHADTVLDEMLRALAALRGDIETYRQQGTCGIHKAEILEALSARKTEMADLQNTTTTRKKHMHDARRIWRPLNNEKTNYQYKKRKNPSLYSDLTEPLDALTSVIKRIDDLIEESVNSVERMDVLIVEVSRLSSEGTGYVDRMKTIVDRQNAITTYFSDYKNEYDSLTRHYNNWGNLSASEICYDRSTPLADCLPTIYAKLKTEHLDLLKQTLDEAEQRRPSIDDVFYKDENTEGSFRQQCAQAGKALDAFFNQVKQLVAKYESVTADLNRAKLDLRNAKGLVVNQPRLQQLDLQQGRIRLQGIYQRL